MRFSIWPSYERPWDEVLERARFVHDNRWHALWYADHFMPQTDDDVASAEPALECWTVLAGVATAVPTIRLTSMVSPVTIHHPVVLAKRAVTVDHLSAGRAVLGIGAGWQVNEHRAYGFELPAPGERVTRFAEAIEVIHRLFNEPRVTFEGSRYQLHDAPFEPKPVQSPLPILVGTGSPRMMRLTARWADEWNTWGDPMLVAERTAAFGIACSSVERDPATVRRSTQALVFITDSDAAKSAVSQFAPPGRSIVGSPAELIDIVGKYHDLGVDELAIPDFTLGASRAERSDAFARFHAEIASAFA